MMRYVAILLIMAMLVARSAQADCNLDELVGFTLVAKNYIVARIDSDGRHDGFEGCQYGRVLVFEDNKIVHCMTYNYHYAYRPETYIFMSGAQIKLCIDGELMDVSR